MTGVLLACSRPHLSHARAPDIVFGAFVQTTSTSWTPRRSRAWTCPTLAARAPARRAPAR